jgi:GT2 family glycosyltransferase
VIVPTTGRIDALDRCLRSLASVPGNHVEIVVVDNRPAARTRELVASWRARDRRLRYIAEARPGLSVARNRGISQTQAEFVAFTDDDVVVEPTWLAWLLAPFVDANVTAVTGLVLPLELETSAQKQFEQYAGFCKGFERRTYDLDANRATGRLLYPYWGGVFGSGNSMAFRRSWLVASGGFDPALGAGTIAHSGEDIDAMSRAILRGGQLVYEPRSLCWHEHRRDEEGLRAQLFGYGVGLTAMLTKALAHDPGFATAAVRSLPLAFATRRRHAERSRTAAALPMQLARIERLGMVWGPVLYARSARSAHRLGLGHVINGG